MSQPAASPDTFVPFNPLPASGAQSGASATKPAAHSNLKVVPAPDAVPAFTPLQPASPAHAHAATNSAGQPVVTLQRDGERITGIRVECPCGQVIELACSY